MTNKMYAALIASVSAAALMFAAGETRAGTPHAGVSSAHPHSHFRSHAPFARHFRHHRFNNNNDVGAVFWPDSGPYGTPSGAGADLSQPIPNDIRNTNAFDIPWDWAHRYPPSVAPSEKPYVPNCPTESVTVPNRNGGGDQTINITRCY